VTLGDTTDLQTRTDRRGRRRRLVAALSLWGLWYAGYRAYYAFGGTVGMIGTPVSESDFRTVNAVGASVIVAAAVVPWLVLVWHPARRAVPVLGWVVAVGCCMHALVDWTLRLLSLTGVHPTQLPAEVWVSYDRTLADLQDVLLNEPWFLVEGLLWAALALSVVRRVRHRLWLVTAVLATLVLTVIGVLSGVGAIGSFVVG
jgi:hypothetical protein